MACFKRWEVFGAEVHWFCLGSGGPGFGFRVLMITQLGNAIGGFGKHVVMGSLISYPP